MSVLSVKSRARLILAVSVFVLVLTGGVFAQQESEDPPVGANVPVEVDDEEAEETPKAPEGLWPSRKLLKSMLTRWVEDVGEDYELDEDQRTEVREAVVERWESFLTENRAEIQPLANEFMEMRMELAPPGKERVQAWTEKALPVFEKSKEQILKTQDEFRQVLRPGQRVGFELEALKTNVGLGLAEGKLRAWREGEIGKYDFWEPLPKDRPERREERRKDREAVEAAEKAAIAAQVPEDQIAVEVGRWEKYVAEFNDRFHLDEGQRNTSFSFLHELKERALSHRDRYREEISGLERRIEAFGGSETELADLKKQLTALYGPIDDMFKELQSRLERLPTSEQRAAQTVRDTPTTPATKAEEQSP